MPAIAEPPEILEVTTTTVACDGGNEPLGHPRVFLNMGEDGSVDCPYCGRRYILKPGTGHHGGH